MKPGYINSPFEPHEKRTIATLAENEGRSMGSQVRHLTLASEKLAALLRKKDTGRVPVKSKKRK